MASSSSSSSFSFSAIERELIPRPKAPIHYIFIGPLQSASTLNHILQMERCVDNPIELVCLSKDVGAYRNALGDAKVEVKAVESYLEEGNEVKQFEGISTRIRKIQTMVLENPARNKIPDRIFFKELIAFYLLALKGGFTMDANVHPAAEEKVNDKEHKVFESKNLKLELPEEKQFCYPWQITPELWMLYAPFNNKAALDILTTYLNNWSGAQEPLAHWMGGAYYPYQYHHNMTNLSLSAIQVAVKINYLEELPAWQFIPSGGMTVNLKGINIKKTYGNSHKHPEHLAERVEIDFRDAAENKNSGESEFNFAALNKISEAFKAQLIDDINCCVTFFNKRFTASAEFSPLTQLTKLLAQKNVTYAALIVEVAKLKNISTEATTLFLKTGVDTQKLWIKNTVERIEKNFKNRTIAMKIMRPAIAINALKSLNNVSKIDDVTSGTDLLNEMKYEVVNLGFCCSVRIFNSDGVAAKSISLMGTCADMAILPNGHVAVSLRTSNMCSDVGHVYIIDPLNFNDNDRDGYFSPAATDRSPGRKYIALLPDGNMAIGGGNDLGIKIYNYSMSYDEIYKKERFKLSLIGYVELGYYLDSKEDLLVELEELLTKSGKLESPSALAPIKLSTSQTRGFSR